MQETIEKAGRDYAGIIRPITEDERYYNPNVKQYDAFIAGAEFFKSQIKKDLLDAINHGDAIDKYNYLSTHTKLTDYIELLKTSLDNLRKLL